jgi:O-antigen ligase
MALWIAWRSGRLFRAAAGLAFCGVLFVSLAPESVLERLSTIGDTQESSAAARLRSWAVAMKMVGDNPLLGVGLRNFQPRYLEYAGIPIDEEARVKTYVAHNSYLQIWAENGSLAFGCFLLMLGSVFVVCRKVYRLGRSRPDMAWAANYARMMEATTVAYMAGAMFLNRGHFDLLYHWLALVTSLYLVARMHHAAAPEAQQGKAFRTGVAVRWKPRLEGGLVARWGRAH